MQPQHSEKTWKREELAIWMNPIPPDSRRLENYVKARWKTE